MNKLNHVELAPYWTVLPPAEDERAVRSGTRPIRIKPGAGFGDGTHATTQLCLLALGSLSRRGFVAKTVLDFGSGSGILSIAAGLLGAQVEAVEIDGAAIEHAKENARLNGVEGAIEHRTQLSTPAQAYDLAVANILRPILVEFAEALSARQSRRGHMVLSGLVATDVPDIRARFGPLLAPMRSQVYERGQWRAVVYSA